jgi:hypothetical protein
MKGVLRWMLAAGILGLMLGVAYLAPLPVPPYLDFQVIYHAGMGLLRGIPLYDHAGQVSMIAELAGVSPAQVFVLPFPYPPWYALPSLPLALLPIDVAAHLWLELNLAMLVLSVWLLSDGWGAIKRLAAIPASLFFLPVLGGLYVGQYSFPVLLGLALAVYALRHERPFWLACALALLTFKPHLGLPAVLAVSLYLWARRFESFPRRALGWIGLIGLCLFAGGYLADPAWPVNYLHSLAEYGGNAGVLSCELCASLSVTVVRWAGVTGLRGSLWVAGVLALASLGILVWKWRAFSSSPECLLSVLVCLTLLTSPYLLNYDYLLLLIPMAFLAGVAGDWRDWFWIMLAFCLPWLGFGLFGRAGNIALVLTAVLLGGALWLSPSGLDDNKKPGGS